MTRREQRLAIVGAGALYALCLARYAWAYYVAANEYGTSAARRHANNTELFWRLVVIVLPLAALLLWRAIQWAVSEPIERPQRQFTIEPSDPRPIETAMIHAAEQRSRPFRLPPVTALIVLVIGIAAIASLILQ